MLLAAGADLRAPTCALPPPRLIKTRWNKTSVLSPPRTGPNQQMLGARDANPALVFFAHVDEINAIFRELLDLNAQPAPPTTLHVGHSLMIRRDWRACVEARGRGGSRQQTGKRDSSELRRAGRSLSDDRKLPGVAERASGAKRTLMIFMTHKSRKKANKRQRRASLILVHAAQKQPSSQYQACWLSGSGSGRAALQLCNEASASDFHPSHKRCP